MKKSKISHYALLLAIILVCPSPGYSASLPPVVGQLLSEAKKAIKSVTMADFKTLYDKKETGLLIDVRDGEEYAAGHIVGAINISRGTLEFRVWKLVGGSDNPDYNRKMMLYCGSGARCVLATKTLMDLGFTNVTAIEMKLADWKNAGYPFEMGE
jgi:rhodanese-related sulfurtransferase